ncbi:MAG TPA: crotonase/enoyl-CoA hydratase family protein [Caulobacter sp.]|nr:crotonase/enoyl-CoA hydratase family protein [Caulobacter sp.]
MSDLVTYERKGPAARIRMDDGKVNKMGPEMIAAIDAAFDRAAGEGAIPVLTGRPNLFSAGFDLKVFAGGDAEAGRRMVRAGAELSLKIMTFPLPVIAGVQGHAFPAGAFQVLSSDWRIGTEGDWTIGLNEVAIGLTIPQFALEVARQRLTPAAFSRTALTGEMFPAREALAAGFVDELVAPDGFEAAIDRAVERLSKLSMPAHAATKAKARGPYIAAIRAAIDAELGGPAG